MTKETAPNLRLVGLGLILLFAALNLQIFGAHAVLGLAAALLVPDGQPEPAAAALVSLFFLSTPILLTAVAIFLGMWGPTTPALQAASGIALALLGVTLVGQVGSLFPAFLPGSDTTPPALALLQATALHGVLMRDLPLVTLAQTLFLLALRRLATHIAAPRLASRAVTGMIVGGVVIGAMVILAGLLWRGVPLQLGWMLAAAIWLGTLLWWSAYAWFLCSFWNPFSEQFRAAEQPARTLPVPPPAPPVPAGSEAITARQPVPPPSVPARSEAITGARKPRPGPQRPGR